MTVDYENYEEVCHEYDNYRIAIDMAHLEEKIRELQQKFRTQELVCFDPACGTANYQFEHVSNSVFYTVLAYIIRRWGDLTS